MYTTKQNSASKSISNVFDELFSAFPVAVQNQGISTKVPVNIHEDAEGYHLELQVPGRSKEEISIKLDQNLLTISADAQAAEQTQYKTIRREFATNSFTRSFNIDTKINIDGIQAKYDQGVLLVFLPKKEELKNGPKQIVVS